MKGNLVLIGGRGAGKSTLTRALLALGGPWTPLPLDLLISYEAGGRSIPALVADEGWHGFRAVEARVVAKAAAIPSGALIDTGGGVVVTLDAAGEEHYNATNVEALKRHGRLVYLRQSVASALARIGEDPTRPSLSAHASFAAIMARRAPWYERAADLIVDVEGQAPETLAETVLSWWSTFEAETSGDVDARRVGGPS